MTKPTKAQTGLKPTWYDIGYAEARDGKEERPPEGQYSARGQYRRGYENGRIDRAANSIALMCDPWNAQ